MYSLVSEHEGWMLDKTKTIAERELVKDLIGCDVNGSVSKLYPTYDEKALLKKLDQLEIQLSNCCKEKAKLKSELEKSKHIIEGSKSVRKNGIKKSTKDEKITLEIQSESDSGSSSEEESSSSSQPDGNPNQKTQPKFAKSSSVIRNNLTENIDSISAKGKVGKANAVASNARGVSSAPRVKGDISLVAAKRNDRDRVVPATNGISKKFSSGGVVARRTNTNLKPTKASASLSSREKVKRKNEQNMNKDDDRDGSDQQLAREISRSKVLATAKDRQKAEMRSDSNRKDGRYKKMTQGSEVKKGKTFKKLSKDEEMIVGVSRKSASDQAREVSIQMNGLVLLET